jgi:hypothetical protein
MTAHKATVGSAEKIISKTKGDPATRQGMFNALSVKKLDSDWPDWRKL